MPKRSASGDVGSTRRTASRTRHRSSRWHHAQYSPLCPESDTPRFVRRCMPKLDVVESFDTVQHHLMAVRTAPRLVPVPRSETRLRVCMMVTYDMASPGGGVKQHALHLAASLRRMGDDVMLVGPSSVPTDEPHVHSFGGIVNVRANGSDNNLGLLVSPRAIAKFFREHRFDVIHIHEPLQPALSYWSVWLTRRIPHVATFHAYMEEEGLLLRWARKAWAATMFPWIQRAIAVSEPAA